MKVERDVRDDVRREAITLEGVATELRDLEAAARWRGRQKNALTRTPACLEPPAVTRSEGRFRNDRSGSEELVTQALAAVTRATREARGAAAEFVPDPVVRRTGAGISVVHLHQYHRGVPVYEAVRSAHFDADGTLRAIVGDHVTMHGDVSLLPRISAADAVLKAALYLGAAGPEASPSGEVLRVSRHPPRQLAAWPLPSRPALYVKRPFKEPISVDLVLFARDHRDLRLGWRTSFRMPAHDELYDLIIGAGESGPEILYCRGSYASATARGLIFRHHPEDDEGRVEVELPEPRDAYPPFPVAGGPGTAGAVSFARGWIGKDRTRGNNALAFRGNRRRRNLRGERRDGDVVFAPEDPLGEDQQLLNAFFYCNYMHDFFALLGFGEAEGSFQEENFSGAPGERDALDIRVFRGAVRGLARISSPRDGRPGDLHLGIRRAVATGDRDRHTALDSDLVFHEYTHGVSSRLAGGRESVEPLRHPESRALAEGYSDFFALTVRSWQTGREAVVFGPWISGDAERGLRRHPYTDLYPFHYGDLADPSHQEPHDAGEIWCAALMRLHRRLLGELGFERGHDVAWRLVLHSLDLLPVGTDRPGFLDARDALTRALAGLVRSAQVSAGEAPGVERSWLEACGATGMGPAARGQGAHFAGIAADFFPFSPP